MKKLFQWIRKWFPESMYTNENSGYILMDAEFYEYQYDPFEDDGAYADDDLD